MRLPLVIRADAGTGMGTGHLMRCLALAQEWRRGGGSVEVVSDCGTQPVRRRIAEEGFRLTPVRRVFPDPDDWNRLSKVLTHHQGAWVVLDGYHFDSDYQSRIQQAGCRLLVIDDIAHLDRYHADVLLNQNLDAQQLRYNCSPHTRMLLGNRYVLLRSEFLRCRTRKRVIPAVAKRVLVTMGGSDPHNQSSKMIRVLRQIDVSGLEAVVVMGPGNPHRRSLKSLARKGGLPVKLVRNATDMAQWITWADVGVSSASSTVWEFAFMGLPAMVLITAENQRKVAGSLTRHGIAVNLGWYGNVNVAALRETLRTLLLDGQQRRQMSKLGRLAVNGEGVKRVISAMNQPVRSSPVPLRLRHASPRDARLLWEWANDPVVRANSFKSTAIPLHEHLDWFRTKLKSPDTRIWILQLSGSPVAQVRYDRVDNHTAEIAISVAPQCRGQGIGTKVLLLTMERACKELGIKRLVGIVLSSNQASIRAFTKAGFKCTEQKFIHRKPSSVFVLEYSQGTEEHREELH